MIKPKEKTEKTHRYMEAVGRRKTSVARVRLFNDGKAGIIVNNKDYFSYFPSIGLRHTAEEPLKETKLFGKIRIEARIKGGGISSQAGALRHGISRALQKFHVDFRKPLKKLGFLKRDPRMKERRKFGLKKARKAPQWSKR
ncbi:MAG: 30S ribosomal protein S9 [Candidatus Tagabacteria bacterium RIFCSPLOWO2_01_FULL_42_9]|uniref:Small ribosomal subunit protein uS9 n=1 Tax=Candidatus Tagabacteria bacterium RIFCSPLOWO2_01_FULL_42_9 TaxID=1802296 RepID=A0A1G2LVX3_9BACT|nr:MAG: 30S ribosomal protein S9 [Candidatus Tagabacteria bacterium RIFCSPLOWO2_01_FULL_42_9]